MSWIGFRRFPAMGTTASRRGRKPERWTPRLVWLAAKGDLSRTMDEYTQKLIDEALATYQEVVAGKNGRIQRGKVLWDQFEAAAEACCNGGKDAQRQLSERVNELAVAQVLADDSALGS